MPELISVPVPDLWVTAHIRAHRSDVSCWDDVSVSVLLMWGPEGAAGRFHRVAAVNVTKHPQQIHFHQNRSVDCSMLLHNLVTLQLLFSLFWLREDELTHQPAVYKVDNCNCNPIDYSSVLKCLSEGRRWEFPHVWVVMFAASSLDKYRLTLFVINVVMSHRHEVKSTCVYPADKQLPAFLVWGPTDVPPTRSQTLCLRIWGGPRDDDEFCVVCNTRQMFLIKDCIVMKDCKKL